VPGFFPLFRYVLLPGIRPTLTLMLILTVIWSFQVFEFIFIITRGRPGLMAARFSPRSPIGTPSSNSDVGASSRGRPAL